MKILVENAINVAQETRSKQNSRYHLWSPVLVVATGGMKSCEWNVTNAIPYERTVRRMYINLFSATRKILVNRFPLSQTSEGNDR